MSIREPGPGRRRIGGLCPAVRSHGAMALSLLPAAAFATGQMISRNARAAITYSFVDLNPSGYTGSYGDGSGPSQQVGYGSSSATLGNYHALAWSGSASGFIDLNPTGYTATNAYAAWGGKQVGAGYGTVTGNVDHALLWNGNAASVIDLNPTGYTDSFANSISGNQIVGTGLAATNGFNTHALMWTGSSAASVVDLNPTGIQFSTALGIGNGQEVGHGALSSTGAVHALLWNGSAAAGAIDLNPNGFSYSYAQATFNGQQVGYGSGTATGSLDHALLWNGSANSSVDLNPTGFSTSYATGAGNGVQVGYGSNVASAAMHALLWNGNAASAIDLNPTGDVSSVAMAVDPYGIVTGYVTIGTTTNGTQHAGIWIASNNKYYTNSAASGAFSPTGNWLNTLAPVSGDNAYVVQYDSVNRTVSYATSTGFPLGTLTVDSSGTGVMTMVQSAAVMNVTGNQTVGEVGLGAYNQTGGTNTVGQTLVVGQTYGSSGTYTLSAGNLVAGSAVIGAAGAGAFVQTGGSATVTGSVCLGVAVGANGSYSLQTGASVLVGGNLIVGGSGTGTFNQFGGTNFITNSLLIAATNGAGSYNLSGGTLKAAAIQVGAGGALAVSAGSLTAPITISSGGQFNYSGGTVSGAITNSGTLSVTKAALQIASALTNNSVYQSDASALSVSATGYLIGGAGDVFRLGGDLTSASTQSAVWNTLQAVLDFSTGGATVHHLSLTGNNMGRSYAGFTSNYAWGTLELDAAQSLVLQNGRSSAALYVSDLDLVGGTNQISLITGNGMDIYYDPSNPANAYLNGQSFVLSAGGAIEPVSVPEPALLAMIPVGALALIGRRRRRRRTPGLSGPDDLARIEIRA